MKGKTSIFISFSILLYFVMLIYISEKHMVLNNIFKAIFELITIPIIIATLVLFAFYLKLWKQENWRIKSVYLYADLVLFSIILLMGFFSF